MLTSSKPATDPQISRRNGRPAVMVTDAERSSALAILRSLKRQGCRTIAASSDPHCANFRSRTVDESLVYDSPDRSPRRTAQQLLEAAARRDVDLIIPVTDDVILPLNDLREKVPKRCVVAIADDDGLQVAWDKQRTWELAQSLGVPCPASQFADTSDKAVEAAEAMGWPVVVKPVSSRALNHQSLRQFRVEYAQDADSLRSIMDSLDGSPGALIQEIVPGVGRGVEVLAHNGQLLAAFQHRRLREVPLSGGVGAFRESESLSPELLDYTRRLMAELNWTGLAMVEFKEGVAGPRLMEINGRVWGSLPLAVCSGMDFPAKLLQMYSGELGAELDTDYRVGVRCRNLYLDLRWAMAVLRNDRPPHIPAVARWRAAAVPLGLFSLRIHWDTWSLLDPLPGLSSIMSSGKRVVKKLFGEASQPGAAS